MSDFLQLILTLIIILSAAKIAGRLSVKFGQPSVFGELLVGILLGPSFINLTHLSFITDPNLEVVIEELGEIGVLLLMFLAGIELHLKDMAKSSRISMFSGSLGVLFPVILGYATGRFFNMDYSSAIFLGLTLAATSVSISAQTLMELGYLRTKVGLGLLGAAVYDDIIVILFLSIFLAASDGSLNTISVLLLIGRMLLFFVITGGFGYFFLPKLLQMISKTSISQGVLTFSLVLLLIYGLAAELIGNMAAITGTFFAGLFFSRTISKDQVAVGIQNLAYGFFVPIFFVSIGLKTNILAFSMQSIWFLAVLLVISIVTKIAGAGIGAKIGGLSWLESYQLGTGMVSRGEVGLIVASIGASTGLISSELLTIVVMIVLLSTLLTPILLKRSFLNPPSFLVEKSMSSHDPDNLTAKEA